MQPEAHTTEVAAPSDSGARPQSPPSAWQSAQPMVLLALMFGIFYFLLIRPQQRRQRETDALLKALKRGDKVRTTGGIRGEILDLTETEVTLLIADKVKINVLRSHIVSRLGAETATAKDGAAKEPIVKEPGKEKA